jgi:hypothetical protein
MVVRPSHPWRPSDQVPINEKTRRDGVMTPPLAPKDRDQCHMIVSTKIYA